MSSRDAPNARPWLWLALATSLGCCSLAAVHAAGGTLAPAAVRAAASTPEDGPVWSSLTVSQRAALDPLARDWSGIGSTHKLKWIDLANRMPKMEVAERSRIQARMADWAKLSPQQRTQARMRFQEAKQVAPRSREEQWAAYQALPPEQRDLLAARAAPASAAARGAAGKNDPKPGAKPESKPRAETKPRAVAPSVVQARPGATTNLMSKRATPPPYQQSGLPKIAATPGFVDGTTLLPKRGPQGAATRAAAASAPITAP